MGLKLIMCVELCMGRGLNGVMIDPLFECCCIIPIPAPLISARFFPVSLILIDFDLLCSIAEGISRDLLFLFINIYLYLCRFVFLPVKKSTCSVYKRNKISVETRSKSLC